MSTTRSEDTTAIRRNRVQAGILIGLGLLCVLSAALLKLPTSSYPVGIMVLGLGLLVAALVNPARLLPAACMFAPLGIVVFLVFRQIIPGSQVLSTYILTLGLGLLAVALLTRAGYIGSGAVTPALLVLLVGAIEVYLPGASSNFLPFALSLWLPGIVFLVLGAIYLGTSRMVIARKA